MDIMYKVNRRSKRFVLFSAYFCAISNDDDDDFVWFYLLCIVPSLAGIACAGTTPLFRGTCEASRFDSQSRKLSNRIGRTCLRYRRKLGQTTQTINGA